MQLYFCVTTNAMVSTYGTTVKTLQNTVHRGLILRKVFINDKDEYKMVTINTTHMFLSLHIYFPLRIHCNEVVSVFIYAVQKYATDLLKGYRSVNTYKNTTYMLLGWLTTFQW